MCGGDLEFKKEKLLTQTTDLLILREKIKIR
jgi:hypothetical protein